MRISSNSVFSRGASSALVALATFCFSGVAVAQSTEPALDDSLRQPTIRQLLDLRTKLRDQDRRGDAPRGGVMGRAAVDPDSGEPAATDSRWSRAASVDSFAAPQDEDYSVQGMFSRQHGKYMVDRKRYEPNLDIWGSYQLSAGLSTENGNFEFNEVGVRLEAEMPVDPDTFLIYGGDFTRRGYLMDQATMIQDTALYQAFLNIGIGRFINEDFLLELRFQPGLSSDFSSTLNRDDWRWFGDVVGTYRTNEQLYWKFGARVDQVFDGTEIYPVLGVAYLINENFRLDILAPRYIELAWLPDAALVMKLGMSLDGAEYSYHTNSGGAADQQRTWRTQEFRVYADVAWRLSDNFSIAGRAGGTLAGKYDIERAAPMPDYDGQIEPTFFFDIGLGLSF